MDTLAHRRRLLASVSAALTVAGLAPGAAETKKARTRKRRNRCHVGPCNYGQCVTYLDTLFPGSSGWAITVKEAYAARCCGLVALRTTGKRYRVAVLGCIGAQSSR